MAIAFLSWLLLTVVAAVICSGIYLYVNKTKLNLEVKGLLTVALWVIGGVIAMSPLYWEFADPPRSIPVTFENGKVVKHQYGVFVIGRQVSNMPLATVKLAMSVTPITENPKVRTIVSIIGVCIKNPRVFYTKEERKAILSSGSCMDSCETGVESGVRGAMQDVLRYLLYEFHNEHSVQLGELYNPLDESQQGKFKLLVEDWMNKHLVQDGLVVAYAKFSVE